MRISFIGAGHITELLINHLVSDVMFEADDLTISDPDGNRCAELKRRFGVSVAADNCEAVSRSDFTFVCVQPHIVRKVIDELKDTCLRGRILISVSAGISTGLYRSELPDAVVARILPNPPSGIGEGAIPVTISGNADGSRSKVS